MKMNDREKLAENVWSFQSFRYEVTEITDYCFNNCWREKKALTKKG